MKPRATPSSPPWRRLWSRRSTAAGAIGFATSRTEVHRTSAGEPIATLTASETELLAIADAMRSAGAGVVQLISDLYQSTDDDFAQAELDLLQRFVETSRRPLSFTMQQAYHSPERWRYQMDWVDRMVAAGHDVKAQVASRPIGVLIGLTATANPFLFCRSYDEISRLDLAERVDALRDPERKRRIVAEHAEIAAGLSPGLFQQIMSGFDVLFRLADPVDYQLDRDLLDRGRCGARRDRTGRAGVRPAARAGRQPTALPAAVQLRPRQLSTTSGR